MAVDLLQGKILIIPKPKGKAKAVVNFRNNDGWDKYVCKTN